MGEDEAPPAPPPQQTIIMPTPQQTAEQAGKANLAVTQEMLDSGILGKYAQQQTDIMRAQAPQMAEINYQTQKVEGPRLIQLALDSVKQADPEGFSIRKKLGEMTLSDLDLGGALSSEETRNLQQDIRAAQVARGGGTALSEAIDEARYLGDNRFARDQQRRSNAASFLNGSTPSNQFGNLNQAGRTAQVGSQDVGGFAAGLFPTTNALIGNQAANFSTYANFTGNSNQLASANHWNSFDRISNPFKEDLMFGIGAAQGVGKIAGNVMGGMAMCWVAEELYGKDSPKTHAIRSYCLRHLDEDSQLGEFCRLYQKDGRKWAQEIKENMSLRRSVQQQWDRLYENSLKEVANAL